MENYLGIDYGRKKIGIAFAPESTLALKLSILPNDEDFYEKLSQIIKEHAVGKVVVGLPLSLDGTKSRETEEAEEFISKLQQEFSEVKVVVHDERLSTVEAEKNLHRKDTVDAEAARIILQAYLDRREKHS